MPTTTTTLQVTFVSESAAYDNTFGWYNSQTGMGGILFADVEQQGPHAPLSPGATVSFTVNTADLPYIQFFLVPDGADQNRNDPNDLTGAIKVIHLSDGTWAVADVDSNGNVIYVHGRPDILNGTGANALFTETSKNAGGIDYASSTVGPNQTPGTLGGDTANGPTGLLAWEDTAARLHAHAYGAPGDADYNDAVFNIVALNHPPETNATSATGNEDTTVAITLSGTDDDGTVTSFRVSTLPANGTLYRDAALTQVIAAGSTVTASGNAATVYFKPNANFNGGASFQYAGIDDDGAQDATPATASITVASVNDAPAGADRTVTINEDASYTFAASDFGFTDPNDTPANALLAVKITTLPGAGTLTDNGAAVSAGQFVSAANIAAGLVKFTPAANGNGTGYGTFTFQVRDGGGTANGGIDLDQSPNTMTINVNAVNDAPSGTTNTVTTNEDAAYTFAAVDFGFTDANDTPPNALLAVKITTVPGAGSLTNNGVAVTPGQSVSVADINAGLLKFTPAANANGAGHASFTFQVQDNGGIANGGVDLDQSPNTMTINVNSVNDAPSGANHTVTANEDIAYTFASADFGFTDPNDAPANALLAVTITTLPGAGSLTDNGVAVVAGQSVSAADIAAGLLKFTPAANASGAAYASFTFQVQDNGGIANGGVDTDQSPNTMTINVNSINDAPAGADNTVHAGSVYVFSTADFGFSDPNDSPANNFAAVEITTLPSSGTLTNNGNAVNAGDFISVADIGAGHLQFTAAGGANVSFTFQVRDDGGTANGGVDLDQSSNTFTLIVNTPPLANDDSVAATEAGGVNNATPGHDPSGNVVLGTGDAGNVQDTDTQDPSAALIVVAAGTGAEGSADNGAVGTAFSGLHGSLLLGSNGAYSYTLNQTDAAVQALHTAADTISDVFHYTIQDTGGLTDSATLTITIHGANDLPLAVNDAGSMTEDDGPTSFNVIVDDTLDPDSTAANTISVGSVTVTGPAGETFVNSDAQATVVANQIQITLDNAHFQQLAFGEHATVTVAYTLTGDAGDTSGANLVVTVDGANDLPVAVDDGGAMTEDQGPTAFTVLGNDTLDPDHGAPNNVTAGAVSNVSAPTGDNIDAGDVSVSVNAGNQIVVTLGSDFQHLGDGESATFDVAYTLHGDQPGDLATATLHVTVAGANDAPIAQAHSYIGIANTSLVLDNGTGAAPTDPAGPQKTVSGSLLDGATDLDGPNPLTVVAETKATMHGNVVINADGDFTYLPDAGFTGSDTFTYTVTDGSTPTAGTDTETVTITVQAPKVWYVDAANGNDTTGDGTSDNPFQTLTRLNGDTGDGTTNDDVDGAGDIIFLNGGTYSGGIVLEDGQQLISKEHGLTVNSVVLEAADGSSVTTVDGTVTLASNPAAANTIQGIDFGTTSGFALTGTNVGDAKVNTVTGGTINNTSGGAVSISGSGTGMDLQFESVSSDNSSTNAISFSNARGTFNAGGGTLSDAAGNTVTITGDGINDDLAFTYGGAISDDGNVLVSITGQSGGTKTFNGALTDGAGVGGGIAVASNTGTSTVTFTHSVSLNTGANTGVSFSGNGANTALNFNNTAVGSTGLDITTSSGTGFSATGGGTVTVQGSGNSIVSTNGTALNIVNTTIGAANVTFEKISSGGGANNGIVLDTTGSSGGLHVTGVGTTAGSGGTIANKTGADGSTTSGIGIYLNGTTGVQLANMQLNDFQNYGILGNNVSGMALDRVIVNGLNGNSIAGVGEGAAYFTGLTGSASVSNSTFTGGFLDGFHVFNNGGQTLNRITITGSTFATNTAAGNVSGDALIFQATNGTFNATVQNSFMTSARGDLFQLDMHQNVVSDLVFTGNTLTNNNANIVSGGGGVTISSGGSGDNATLTFNISNNAMRDALGTALGISTGPGSGAFSGTINNNTIGVAGVANSGSAQGSGIGFVTLGGDSSNVTITNNTIRQYSGAGLLIQVGDHLSGGNAQQTFVVQGNTIDTPGTNNGQNGFLFNAGTNSGDAATISLTLGGPGSLANQFAGSGIGGSADMRLRDRFDVKVGLHSGAGGTTNYAGGPQDTTAVANFVTASNTGTVSVVTGNPGSGFFGSPLFAALGGVDATPGQDTTGVTYHLDQVALDAITTAAIARWAAAGLSADQVAQLRQVTVQVGDTYDPVLGQMDRPGHITIDTDAAGHGWFVDASPFDDSEFAHTLGATHLQTDPTAAPAGHFDLLTTVMHELGHQIGLDDVDAPGVRDDLMFEELTAGERRMPGASDVVQADKAATVAAAQAAEDALPVAASAPDGTPIIAGTSGDDTFHIGQGGTIVAGGGGADTFFFDPAILTAPAAPVTHVADYSAAQGDVFDFSALLLVSPGAAITDVRALEDTSGAFATLQVQTVDATGFHWISVAQLDGVHTGDPVNVALDAAHVAYLHAGVFA